jgi:hypothetical protein
MPFRDALKLDGPKDTGWVKESGTFLQNQAFLSLSFVSSLFSNSNLIL